MHLFFINNPFLTRAPEIVWAFLSDKSKSEHFSKVSYAEKEVDFRSGLFNFRLLFAPANYLEIV